MSPGKVIDNFHESLSKKDIEYIENGYLSLGEDADDPRLGITTIDNMLSDEITVNNGEVFTYNSEGLFGQSYQGSLMPFDMAGNVRVIKMYWKSKRAIQKIKYYDQMTGEEKYEFFDETYIPNTTLDFEEYFEDVIGVTKSANDIPVKISLRFSAHRLPYVLSKPMHESQRNSRADEGIIELELVPNKEFYQRLLSFGSDVEVLEPQFVREEMTKNAQKLYELYKK